jgi:hypothetical protein
MRSFFAKLRVVLVAVSEAAGTKAEAPVARPRVRRAREKFMLIDSIVTLRKCPALARVVASFPNFLADFVVLFLYYSSGIIDNWILFAFTSWC